MSIVFSKYKAQKTIINGIKYDSKKEARDGLILQSLCDSGKISNLRRQVSFELQPAYTNSQGKRIRAISYVADFVYEQDGKIIVADSKGFRTDVYKLKKKMFEYKYPEYIFIEK